MAAFATLASRYPREVQTRMARRTAIFYAITILVVTWAGRPLLNVLGLSLPALRVAGGFVLLLAALPMVTLDQKSDTQKEAEVEVAAESSGSWVEIVAVPLTFPISIGGATVAAVNCRHARAAGPTDPRARDVRRVPRDDGRRLAHAALGRPAHAPHVARGHGRPHGDLGADPPLHRVPGDRGGIARLAARSQPRLKRERSAPAAPESR